MGVVFKARDRLIGRTVALKTIPVDSSSEERAAAQERAEHLVREAMTAGSLDHPNIITIYDVVLDRGVIYLSMQFVEGSTLAALLKSRVPLRLSDQLKHADQICQAVAFAHQRGVIHRDLKPSNLMLTKQGSIKVLDFGIAKFDDCQAHDPGEISGTPSYMSPEQATGGEVDQRSDIFSLGAVFYELFTGKKPFTGPVDEVLRKVVHENPVALSAIKPSLPAGLGAIIMKALAKDPLQRFQDCGAMAAAFRRESRLLEFAPPVCAAAAPTWKPKPVPAVMPPSSPVMVVPQKKANPLAEIRSLTVSKYWKAGIGAVLALAAIAVGASVVKHVRAASASASASSSARSDTKEVVEPGKPSETAEQRLAEIRQLAASPGLGTPARAATVEVTRAPASAAVGGMEIVSLPAGATVEIEGVAGQNGQTPLTVGSLAPGSYKIKVRKRGYAPEARVVEVSSGKRAAVEVKLAATQGFLTVTSTPEGASIWIEGRDTGKVTPAEFALDPAAHSIVLRKDDYLDEPAEINITAGDSASYSPNLRAAGRTDNIKSVGGFSKMFGGGLGQGMAQIEIKTEPKGAQILVNGKALEKATPAVIQVEAGNYDIVLKKDGYRDVRTSLSVSSQEKTKIKETLVK
jgi:serine/threonine-protein kinase